MFALRFWFNSERPLSRVFLLHVHHILVNFLVPTVRVHRVIVFVGDILIAIEQQNKQLQVILSMYRVSKCKSILHDVWNNNAVTCVNMFTLYVLSQCRQVAINLILAVVDIRLFQREATETHRNIHNINRNPRILCQ
jgi:hypothetical protein